MKNFTVNIGGQSMTMPGPDDASQEDAQKEAERQYQAKQAADVQRDFSGETGRQGILGTGILGGDFGANVGRKAANFAQGAGESVAAPAQLMGGTPSATYQRAEAMPTDTGDKIARFAGATLPTAPLGAAGATVGRVIGGVQGASAPAGGTTQRVINTGLGALVGGFGRGAPGSSQLDKLAGTAAGMLMGHGLGGAESMFSTYLGGKIGGSVGPAAHEAVAALLRKFPPSVVARALVTAGEPFSKMLASEYDYMASDKPNAQTQSSGPPGR